jgi:hypothetical protein
VHSGAKTRVRRCSSGKVQPGLGSPEARTTPLAKPESRQSPPPPATPAQPPPPPAQLSRHTRERVPDAGPILGAVPLLSVLHRARPVWHAHCTGAHRHWWNGRSGGRFGRGQGIFECNGCYGWYGWYGWIGGRGEGEFEEEAVEAVEAVEREGERTTPKLPASLGSCCRPGGRRAFRIFTWHSRGRLPSETSSIRRCSRVRPSTSSFGGRDRSTSLSTC